MKTTDTSDGDEIDEDDVTVTQGSASEYLTFTLNVAGEGEWDVSWGIHTNDDDIGPVDPLTQHLIDELGLPAFDDVRRKKPDEPDHEEKTLTEWLDDPHLNSAELANDTVSIKDQICAKYYIDDATWVVDAPDAEAITVHC
jgi:hypothetical protein